MVGLATVHQDRAQVVIILAGAGRVDLRGFGHLGHRFRVFLGIRQRKPVIVVGAGVVRLQRNRLRIRVDALLHFGVAIRAGLGGGVRQI